MGHFDILKSQTLHLEFMNYFPSLGVTDLPQRCELNLGFQISISDFRVRHGIVSQDAAPGYIQTLRSPSDWLYTVQSHWRQHH